MKHAQNALIIAFFALNYACQNQFSSPNEKANNFVLETMKDAYLWENQMPKLDPRSETDTKEFFKKLLYKDDRWSYITDEAGKLNDQLEGVETTFGYHLLFYRIPETENFFAFVEYVDNNSPAARAGVARGDIFVLINGEKITAQNYKTLLTSANLVLAKGELVNKNIVETSKTVLLVAEKMTVETVLLRKIVNVGASKVGYLAYTGFVGAQKDDLNRVLKEFKTAGVNEVVLDLRFNGGGDEVASTLLCSSLAPSWAMEQKKVLIYNYWNETYTLYWRLFNKNHLQRNFTKVENNLDLKRLFVLTSKATASASELTIVGLKPYMDVVQIGDTTYGKYTSMLVFQGKNEIANWAIMPIVAKYANADGFTDFGDGLAPDFLVQEQHFPALPLGDESEPLFAKALMLISGSQKVDAKSLPRESVDFQEVKTEKKYNPRENFILYDSQTDF